MRPCGSEGCERIPTWLSKPEKINCVLSGVLDESERKNT